MIKIVGILLKVVNVQLLEDFLGHKHSNKTKLLLREKMLGKTVSQETKNKIKLAKQNISDITRKKMSEAQKKREPVLHTTEYKKYMSDLYKSEGNPCFGKVRWNNGESNRFSIKCPGFGWKKDALKRKNNLTHKFYTL